MKHLHQSVALAGLLALALAISGCNAMRGKSSSGSSGSSGATGYDSGKSTSGSPTSSSGSSGTSGTTGTSGTSGRSAVPETELIQDDTGNPGGSGSSGSSGSSGTTGSDTSGMQDDRGGQAATSSTPQAKAAPNSTVLAIEILPASGGITEGNASMGASGTAGATGSSNAGPSYRVTVRMDDGSTQVVTHGTTPDFRSGDRIHVVEGAIQR